MKIIPAHQASIRTALDLLQQGKLVALPTETVYGLAADSANDAAVESIYKVKGRPSFNPLIVHVSSIAMAARYAKINDMARRLIKSFWPGPLTLVLPLQENVPISCKALAGLSTIALRQPMGIFCDIIEKLGRPIVAPSANPSGCLSPTSAQAVASFLAGKIPLILDGGPCKIGVESTIVKVETEGKLTLLRPGGLPRAMIEAAAAAQICAPQKNAAIESPGMLLAHYAPKARLYLNAARCLKGQSVLLFGPNTVEGQENAQHVFNLSPKGDIAEAASNLFALLKKIDDLQIKEVAVAPLPRQGLGEAVNDRLQRAALTVEGKKYEERR